MRNIRRKLWNLWAHYVLGYERCDICDDTRGGVVGNGHYHTKLPDIRMCDYCSADYMKYGPFWEADNKNPAR